jgi:hypothetical protein
MYQAVGKENTTADSQKTRHLRESSFEPSLFGYMEKHIESRYKIKSSVPTRDGFRVCLVQFMDSQVRIRPTPCKPYSYDKRFAPYARGQKALQFLSFVSIFRTPTTEFGKGSIPAIIP